MSKENTIIDIQLPKLGESIQEATILNWLVEVGDVVDKGQALLEVATDKVDSEIPSPIRGKIIRIDAEADEVVKVGTIIGTIVATDEALTTQKQKETTPSANAKKSDKPNPNPASKSKKAPQYSPSHSTSKNVEQVILEGRNDNRFFSPLVKQIAINHHISYEELARIPASGQDGRLRKSDIFKYLEEGRPAQFVQTISVPDTSATKPSGFQIPDLKLDKGTGKIVELDRMGQMIAKHMVFSKIASPHVTAYIEADMTDMVNWRNANKQAFQEKYGQRLTFTPLFVRAVARAIQDFPKINSSIDGNKIIIKEDINVGIGAALPSGNIIVPVIRNADKKDLKTLATEVNELVEKARNNKLSADDTRGGTFTISNVGTFGSLMGTPVINQPEAAILATGSIKKRAEVMEYEDGDKIEIRQMMYLCLSFDHSFIDGHLAGSFLKRIAENFEDFKSNEKI